jgi:large subunit ribosomal protein L14e
MTAIELGRLCVKIAGRDSGKECLIVEVIDPNFVMIDGNTRRRKCNVRHLEILPKTAKIKKGASHDEVAKALETLGFKVEEQKVKSKKSSKKETNPESKSLKEKIASKVKKAKPAKKEKIDKKKK